jgi:hypothetical protein
MELTLKVEDWEKLNWINFLPQNSRCNDRIGFPRVARPLFRGRAAHFSRGTAQSMIESEA